MQIERYRQELLQDAWMFESFNSSFPFIWTSKTELEHKAEFIANDQTFVVSVMRRFDVQTAELLNEVVLTFGPKNMHSGQWIGSVTGEHGTKSLKIYSTVFEIISEFIRTETPDKIELHAFDQKKVRVYRTIIRRLANRFPRFVLSEQSSPMGVKFVMSKEPTELTEMSEFDRALNEASYQFAGQLRSEEPTIIRRS